MQQTSKRHLPDGFVTAFCSHKKTLFQTILPMIFEISSRVQITLRTLVTIAERKSFVKSFFGITMDFFAKKCLKTAFPAF